MRREKAERRCHREGFREKLPEAPFRAVTDSTGKRNTKEGEEGWRLTESPITTPAGNPCGLLGSLKGLWPTF